MLTGLQFIAEKVDEWDVSVPNMFKLGTSSKELVSLLLRWRRMERDGWKALLQAKESEIEQNDLFMFIKLQESLKGDIDDLPLAFSVLDEFVKLSNMGTFIPRLKMIRLLALLERRPVVRKMLEQVGN